MATLLLVEDDVLAAAVVREALEDDGYAVVWAANGQDARRLLTATGTALAAMVTDINLGPGPSGFDIAEAARAEQPCLPIVYMTGDSHALFEKRGVAGSVLLPKPVAPANIVAAVRDRIRAEEPCGGPVAAAPANGTGQRQPRALAPARRMHHRNRSRSARRRSRGALRR